MKRFIVDEEEKSQRHLEGLNMAMRGSGGAEREREQREREQRRYLGPSRDQENQEVA